MKKKYGVIDCIIVSISAIVVLFLVANGLFMLVIGLGRANATRLSMRADEMSPAVQPGTLWQSKDGRITLSPIAEDDEIVTHVTVETESGAVELEMYLWLYGQVYFEMPNENADNEEISAVIAQGQGNCRDYDKYIVKISSAKDIFEPGERIVFYRISTPEPEEAGEAEEPQLGAARKRPMATGQ